MVSTPSRSRQATRISAPLISSPRSVAGLAAGSLGLVLVLIDWNKGGGYSSESVAGSKRGVESIASSRSPCALVWAEVYDYPSAAYAILHLSPLSGAPCGGLSSGRSASPERS